METVGEMLTELVERSQMSPGGFSRSLMNDAMIAASLKDSGAVLVTRSGTGFERLSAVEDFAITVPWPQREPMRDKFLRLATSKMRVEVGFTPGRRPLRRIRFRNNHSSRPRALSQATRTFKSLGPSSPTIPHEPMSVIVSRSGRNATKLNKTTVESEAYLQRYIYENPESLPLDEYKDDLQLLILAREFPTGSGPIDALGVDQDGEIYLIETKLYKNPDKRLVLAQVLDYGASLWRTYGDPEEFITRLQGMVSEHFNVSLREKLEQAFDPLDDSPDAEWSVEDHLDALRENVSAGSFRFVVLMDRLEDRLKDLITFINQNSRFDVFGVELEFYEYKDLEILIPKLFGAEVKKSVGGSSGSYGRRRWDEASFMEDVEKRLDGDHRVAVKRLYRWAQEHADQIDWGSGKQRGSFSPKFTHVNKRRSPFSVFSDGALWLNFRFLQNEHSRPYAKRLGRALRREIEAFEIPEDIFMRLPEIPVATWAPHLDEFTSILERVLLDEPVAAGGDGVG